MRTVRRRARFAACLAAVALAALVLPACSDGEAAAGNRLVVATTVSPITNLAALVAGDLADVVGIVPEGTNSHTFEPPPSAARTLSRAGLVFVNGLSLEQPTVELARANGAGADAIVLLGDRTLTPDQYVYDFSFPKEAGKPNPHVWTNPPMAKRYAEVVAGSLAERDPVNAGGYRANLAKLLAGIDALDVAMRTATATVPPNRRVLLTYHDAYAYFAREYGWRVLGAVQVSDFEEPTAREVAALIAQVRAAGVPAIFGSEVFPSPVLEQIGREAGVRYVDELRDDDLPGRPGDAEHSYLGLMRFNFRTMVAALGGDPSALDALDTTVDVPDRARYPQ